MPAGAVVTLNDRPLFRPTVNGRPPQGQGWAATSCSAALSPTIRRAPLLTTRQAREESVALKARH
jgi:hypothetical protein